MPLQVVLGFLESDRVKVALWLTPMYKDTLEDVAYGVSEVREIITKSEWSVTHRVQILTLSKKSLFSLRHLRMLV